MKAIILAGGLGTRLRPLTDQTPKPLLLIKGKPILWHSMMNLKKHGITDIILSVCYRAEKIEEYFKDGAEFGLNIEYSLEKEPLGTGGAIKLASKGIDETFIVLNGDNLGDFDHTAAISEHNQNNALLTIALYPVVDVTKWGIVELKDKKIIRFVEKPSVEEAPSNLNNAGLYIMEPQALDILPEGRSSIEYDCFEKLCGPDGSVFGFTHEGQWFPTDDLKRYEIAQAEFVIEDR